MFGGYRRQQIFECGRRRFLSNAVHHFSLKESTSHLRARSITHCLCSSTAARRVT
jgi:hypothetical protein